MLAKAVEGQAVEVVGLVAKRDCAGLGAGLGLVGTLVAEVATEATAEANLWTGPERGHEWS